MSEESGPRTSGPRPAFASGDAPDPASTVAHPHAYPHARRVTRGAELTEVRAGGRRVRTDHLDVRVAPGPPPSRVGIVVPKHKHGSVERNRVKRRLRELARQRLLPAVPAGRVWLRARPEAYRATFAQLAADVERVAREASRLAAAAPALAPESAPASRDATSGVPEA